ncbi:MAG: hypothetical protein H6492_01855 [Candidatus Paracaedibacteraceae bacterium]|nr:hypothetical protein [Candidatus Paracaedibacteraceae bacterium]
MINTPEFWVGIAFLICIVIFIKVILPKLQVQIDAHRRKIESDFFDAESILLIAQKKISASKERLDSVSETVQGIEKDFEIKINNNLKEWADRKEKIAIKYHQAKEYNLHSIKNHIRNRVYFNVAAAACNVLERYSRQKIKAKDHQKIVLESLKHFPKI